MSLLWKKIFSKTPIATDLLTTRPPVEGAVAGANTMSRLDYFDESGRIMRPDQINQKILHEIRVQEIQEEKARVEQNQEVIEDISGKVSEVLAEVKDVLTPVELSRMDEVIKSLKGKKYQDYDYDILVESGPYGGVYYKVLDIVMKKSKNGESLTQLENDILDAAAFTMGGKSLRHLLAYPAMYKRSDWIEAKKSDPYLESNYYPQFRLFTERLLEVLTNYRLISRPDISLLDGICTAGNPSASKPSKILERMEKGNPNDPYFNPNEETLDIFFIRLEGYILSSLSEHSGEIALDAVEILFRYYYRISGFDIYNKFYRPAKLVAYRISEELRKMGMIDSCHLSDVNNLVKNYFGESFEFRELFHGGTRRLNWNPDPNTISDYVETILQAVQKKLDAINPTQSTRIYNILSTNIGNIKEDYLDFLISAKDGLGLLENNPSSPRRVLIHDIIISLAKHKLLAQILEKSDPINTLSKLLFGGEGILNRFLFHFEKRPLPNKILSLYISFTGDVSNRFDKLGLTIKSNQIRKLQKDIYKDIKSWLFSNPYKYKLYISENPTRSLQPIKKNELSPDYDFVFSVWIVHAIHQDKADLSFTKFRGYGVNIFNKILRDSNALTENAWRILMHGMLDIYEADSPLYPKKAVIYRKCIKEAIKYAKLREFSFSQPSRPAYHRHLFNEEYIIAYNVIMELAMFHGIDPIDFRMIEDEAFSKDYPLGPYKYARHEPFGFSLSPFDQILTTFFRNTGIYRTTARPQQRVAKSLLKQLMLFEKRDAGGNLLDIDHTDIMKIYGKQNSWIYENWGDGVWYNDPEFIKVLDRLNHLRQEIRQKPIDQYLEDNWEVVHNRFWVNFIANSKSRCDLYYLIYELEGLGDDNLAQDILSIDFAHLFSNLLSDHGYPVRL